MPFLVKITILPLFACHRWFRHIQFYAEIFNFYGLINLCQILFSIWAEKQWIEKFTSRQQIIWVGENIRVGKKNILITDRDNGRNELHVANTQSNPFLETCHLCLGQRLSREIFSFEDLFCSDEPAYQSKGKK